MQDIDLILGTIVFCILCVLFFVVDNFLRHCSYLQDEKITSKPQEKNRKES